MGFQLPVPQLVNAGFLNHQQYYMKHIKKSTIHETNCKQVRPWKHALRPKRKPRKSKDQTLPISSRESFTWIIPKTILCLVLDFQGKHSSSQLFYFQRLLQKAWGSGIYGISIYLHEHNNKWTISCRQIYSASHRSYMTTYYGFQPNMGWAKNPGPWNWRSLRIHLCVLRKGLPRSNPILGMGFFDHQSYSIGRGLDSEGMVLFNYTSWWFQQNWKILVQLSNS